MREIPFLNQRERCN